MFITDKELERIVNNKRNLLTGRQYYHRDYVKKIEIDYDGIDGTYLIKGTVDNDLYEDNCEIVVDSEDKIIDYDCDCYWCNYESACGHIAAVLLKVQELSPDTFPFIYDSETIENSFFQRMAEMRKQQEEAALNHEFDITKDLINTIRDREATKFNALKLAQKYDIDVLIYDNYDSPYLKFKVGAGKKYVIKNIPNFLDAIDRGEYVKYGKELGFRHSMDVFSDDAKSIITMMRYSCFVYEQSHDDYYGMTRITNELEILPSSIDVIFDCLEALENSNEHLQIETGVFKPTLTISESDRYFKIELEDFDGICGNKGIYLFSNDTILKSGIEASGKVIKIIAQCVNNDQILVAKNDMNDFIKYILSDIKDYFNIVGTELAVKTVDDEILTLYGDITEQEQVKLYLESNRDGKIVYSFDHEGEATSINFDLIEDYLKDISDVVDYEKHSAYLNLENEKTYTFLNEGLPFLADYCEIMVSDNLQRLGKKSSINLSIGVTIENDLLAIDVESINIPKEELAAVLNSYQKKRKYHRLKNGHLLYLESDELAELDDFMNDYNLKPKMLENGHVDMNVYRAFSVDDKANDSNYVIYNRSEIFKEAIDNFRNIKNANYPLSDYYNNLLRDYQKFGYQWLQAISAFGFGGILADDMGLGKTLQVITLLDTNKDVNKTSIVVCPSSLLLNWQDEIKKFASDLKCQCVYGSVEQRKIAISSFNEVDVLITTYDYMRRDYLLYQDYQFEYVILDEAQYIKNPKTKNAISVKSLKAKHRFALTGTPIENSLAELWSIFDFLMPDYLYNYHYFQSHYETPIVKNHDEKKQSELKKLISPFILRRNKKDVLKELPEKVEKILSYQFSEEENKLYLANLVQVNQQLQEQLNYDGVDRIAVLAMLTKLRQICCEPRTVYENITNISSKLAGCLELIRNLQVNKQKVLLFSSFTSVLDLIGEELSKEGISFYKLTGKTSKKERHELVNQFQNDDTTVFLISLKAGGTGLNLTAAQAVIHFDPWWNMSAQSQATDRAHRIGQVNMVTVYKLVMKDSIEEKIIELQNQKKNLADSFVENNDGSITSMSTEDILELFKI